jgi:hypothetical protein
VADVIVDTNVAVVANGRRTHAGLKCQQKCLEALIKVRKSGRVLIDQDGKILKEYLRQKPHKYPLGVGDAFLVWVFDNQANEKYVRKVEIHELSRDRRLFEEFPTDPALRKFDPSDRVFVAVAVASKSRPRILNASDNDWWEYRMQLKRNGVIVTFLCPELMGD